MIGSTADIDFVLAETGQAVTFGLQSCNGLLDREPINDILGDEIRVIGERLTLTIRDGALANLVNDAVVIVAAANYVIKDTGTSQPDGLRVLTVVEQ